MQVRQILDDLIQRYPTFVTCKEEIESAYFLLKECYDEDGKVLVCGNGASSADAEHMVGQLLKGFTLKRPIRPEAANVLKNMFPEEGLFLANNLQGALPAISLVGHPALTYAFSNDLTFDMVFAQQVYGLATPKDVVVGFSTSGNSKNVVNAIKVAKAFGIKTLGLTGQNGGVMEDLCDVTIKVPAKETFKIHELHLPVYNALCIMLENRFFD